MSFKNRSLGVEHWVDEVLPEAVRAVHEHSGGRGVHLVGWSLGGIFALLVAADRQDLPIASLTVVGSPVDVTKVPLVAPVRPLLNLTQGRGAITRAYRALGGVPKPLVNWAFTAASAQKVVTKPLAVLTHLDDTDYLAQMEAVDRFTRQHDRLPRPHLRPALPPLRQGQRPRARQHGGRRPDDRPRRRSRCRCCVFAGNTDGIAPLPAVRAVVPLLTGAPEVQFEVVPGGHLGMLTGRAARGTTWTVIDEWVDEWSAGVVTPPRKKAAAGRRLRRRHRRRRPSRREEGRQPRSRPAKKASAAATIGSNPTRRYGSAGSRALGPR